MSSTSAYGYKPNVPLAVVGTIVFGIAACYHAFLFVRQRSFYFWALLLAALMETSACGLRAYSTIHPAESRKYLISYLLLILSPSILTLALFATLDRVIWYTTPSFRRSFTTTWIPSSGLVQKLFKLTYFGSFLVEWAGGATLIGSYTTPTSTEPSSPDLLISAERMLKAAFIVQAICTGVFLIIVLHFIVVSRKWTGSTLLTEEIPAKRWQTLLTTTALVTTLIILRTVYRSFEYSASTPGIKEFIHAHEFTFWACDAAPMLAVLVLFALTHPGQCLPRAYTKFWFRKGKVRKMEKKILETQTWPPTGWSQEFHRGEKSDVEHGSNGQTPSGLPWPGQAHLPMRN